MERKKRRSVRTQMILIHANVTFLKNNTLTRFMVKPHTSDIRMTYEYIRVTYG